MTELLYQKNVAKEVILPFNINNPEQSFPLRFRDNPKLQELIIQRNNLEKSLTDFFDKVDPHINVSDALKAEFVTEVELIEIYQELQEFLTAEPNNLRLILYVPLNLLADSQNFGGVLKKVYSEFINVFRNAWLNCLGESDVRASFIDGDVGEDGMIEPERIRKAAHLIPFLVSKSIVTIEEIYYLIEISEETELAKSLQEGLSSLTVLKEQSDSKFEIFGNLDQLVLKFIEELDSISIERNFSEKRANWLMEVSIDGIIKKFSNLIIQNNFVGDIFFSENSASQVNSLFLTAIFENAEKTKHTSEQDTEFIKKISQFNEFRNLIKSGLNKLAKLRLVSVDLLNELSIELVDLSNQSLNSVEREVSDLSGALESIRNNPILNKNLFDQVLLFGSKVKGYSDNNSDSDVVIFFRPEAKFEEREIVLDLLKTIPQFADIDKILEYWIDVDSNGYKFKSIPHKKTMIGAQEIHILFGSVWIGSNFKLREDLFSKYLDLSRCGENRESIRTHLLRQLELDVVQFRLMHKGYRRFNPTIKISPPNNPSRIDWYSDFWDEGYRRTATLLFLKKVFLPDLA